MGNEFSTRWGTTIVRLDTDLLPKLDVRQLSRTAALRPGTVSQPTWQRDGISLSVTSYVDPLEPSTLVLQYLACQPAQKFHFITEVISLTYTSCTFGGKRVWFLCPGCRSRRAVLFCLGGRFLCRVCHNLAYSSTRKASKRPSLV